MNWEWLAWDSLFVVGGFVVGLALMGFAFFAVFFRNILR